MSTYNVSQLDDLRRNMALTSQRMQLGTKQRFGSTSSVKNDLKKNNINSHPVQSNMNAVSSNSLHISKLKRVHSKFRRKIIPRPVGYTWNRFYVILICVIVAFIYSYLMYYLY